MNLIEVEFHDQKEVVEVWHKLNAQLSSEVNKPTPEEWGLRVDKLKAQLIAKIAHSLGYKAVDLDVFSGGYAPQAWTDNETRTRFLFSYLYDLATQRNALPVFASEKPPPRSSSPPPPAPAIQAPPM